MRYSKLTIIIIAIAIIIPSMSLAQGKPAKSLNIQEELKTLTSRMKKDPTDMEAYYKYARLSSRTGHLRSAENAYLHMLKINPNLDRVKSALAIIYIRMARKDEAKILLREILENNPPPKIKQSVAATLNSLESQKPEKKTNTNTNTKPVPAPAPIKQAKIQKQADGSKRLRKLLKEIRQKEVNKENETPNSEKELDPKIKKELLALKQEAEQNPNNLDSYFSLAKLSEKLGEAEIAEEAYLHMLEKEPKLDRVRLDLGLLYVKTGKLKKAKTIFEEVLAKNPPPKVKENITNILAKVKNAMKKNIFTGSVSAGVNRDSNATSAASTGETTFSDISIPLAANSTAKEDAQYFASASLTHIRKFDTKSKNWGATFNTTGTYYKTSQTTEHQLDISLASLKAGPTFNINKLKSQVSATGSISLIYLNSFKYIKTRAGDLTFKYAPSNKLIFDNTLTFEYRKYSNNPTTSTNTDRTGHAYQNKIGATYVYTDKDIFSSSITWRNESARAARNAYDQINFTMGYTRQLPYDMALNALAGFKRTNYDDLDTTISSTILRRDLEKTFTLTLAKKLPKNVTLTTSYQYKNANSNIQNFTYDNHRISGAVGWSF